MPNTNKPAAIRFESDVTAALQKHGLIAIRPRQTKQADVGDIHVDTDIVVQAKSWTNIATALTEGLAGARKQAVSAGRPFGVVAIKKRGGRIEDTYIAMPLSTFASLLRSRQSP